MMHKRIWGLGWEMSFCFTDRNYTICTFGCEVLPHYTTYKAWHHLCCKLNSWEHTSAMIDVSHTSSGRDLAMIERLIACATKHRPTHPLTTGARPSCSVGRIEQQHGLRASYFTVLSCGGLIGSSRTRTSVAAMGTGHRHQIIRPSEIRANTIIVMVMSIIASN